MQIYVGIVHLATTIHNPYVTGRIDLFLMTMAAVSSDAAHLAPACSGLPLMTLDAPAGRVFLRRITRAAAMVIDVVCGPMAYKTQLLAYHYVENQSVHWSP